MSNTINLAPLFANSWAAGNQFEETVDAVTYVILAKGATLPLASPSLSSTNRPVPYSTPSDANGFLTDWRWSEDKTLIIQSLVREIALRYHTILPSAFFEAIEAVLEVFKSVRDSDPTVIEGLAVDTELLFVGAFFLITRAYYEPRFTTRDLDFVSGSRYGAYLQPSAWLDALNDALALCEEEADADGLVRARTGMIADCRAMLDEYRVLVTEERRAFGIHMSHDDKSETAVPPVTQELVDLRRDEFNLGDVDEDEVDPSLSALAYQLWAEAQAAEADAVSISEGRRRSQAPSASRRLSASRLPRPISRSTTVPSVPASSFIITTAYDASTTNPDIPPAGSIIFGLPHPLSTVESLAALLAEGPEDWHEQLTEMRLMIDSVESSLHAALARNFDRSPPSPTSTLPSSGMAAALQSELLGIPSTLPSTNSLASTVGSIRIDVIAPTPQLPVSVSIPEWLEATQPSAFLSNGPSDISLSEGSVVQPFSNPSTHSDLSTLVGEGYTINAKPKPTLGTTRSSASADWLAFCRGKFQRSPSGLSAATTLSEDSAGWLADGSTTSSLALRRVPNGPSASSSLTVADTPADASAIPAAVLLPSQSKFGAFVRKLRLRRGQGEPIATATMESVSHSTPSRAPSPVPSPTPEGLDDWNVVVYLPDPVVESAKPKSRWTQKLGSTKGWFMKGAKAQMIEKVPRA